MRRLPPPLRFLVGVCAGWTCARAGLLWIAAAGGTDSFFLLAPRPLARAGPAAAALGSTPLQAPRVAAVASPIEKADPPPEVARRSAARSPPWMPAAPSRQVVASALALPPPEWSDLAAGLTSRAVQRADAGGPPALAAPAQDRSRRWSLSAWAFVRRGGTDALAPGGMLGGSQAGIRATYRLGGGKAPLALSARLSTPIERPQGAEAAAGLDWKPLAAVPVHLLLERRQRLGRDGRSAFDATLYGGGETRAGPLRIDGYAQAGIVGLRRKDLFADGGVRATLPLGPLRLGAGAWAAVQPNVSRLDVGPHARVQMRPLNAALSADWRFRISGNARPGSGPAVTLAGDF
jgi:hypothetical protein